MSKDCRGNPNPVMPDNFGKTFTPEERRKNSSKGGINSVKVKREKKRVKEILDIFLSMPLKKRKEAEIEEIKAFEELKGKNITVNEAIQLRQVQRALNGDLASATYIRDTVGDKPSDNVNVNAEVKNPLKDLTTEELRKLINSNEDNK
jgi:hypothetical protein